MSFIVIAHNIRSAHNIGSIFRTADGVGADKIFLTGYTPIPATADTLYLTRAHKDLAKTALGAEKSVPWQSIEDIFGVLQMLKAQGYAVASLEQDGASVDYRSYQPAENTVLIVGNEIEGVDKAILRQCDAILEIPMRGNKNSLNVSVAFGIAAFEIKSKLEVER